VRRARTLRGRLAIAAAAVTALWVVALTVAFNLLLASQLRREATDVLRTKAEAVAAALTIQPDGTIVDKEPRPDDVLDTLTWLYQGSAVLEHPRGQSRLQPIADRLAGTGERLVQVEEPVSTRFYAMPLTRDGKQVGTVVTALGLDPYRRVARLALLGSGGLAVLLLAGVYVTARFVVARALRPVTDLSAQAATWSTTDVSRRFGTAQRPAELAQLAASFDGLLDRLSAVLRHEQQLSAELSHELRTPLSRIIAETELLSARGRTAAERRSAHEQIAASAEQMRSILETLLSVARAQGNELPGRGDLAELCRRASERWPTGGPRLVVDTPAEPVAAGLSLELVDRITAPLLANAQRYARTTVTLRAEKVDGLVKITVKDDGPGIPDAARPHVFEPGFRADPHDQHDGVGLGLSLSRRLARVAGGDVSTEPSDEGAVFVVSLPAG
jgi:signal transduction histidine kinase